MSGADVSSIDDAHSCATGLHKRVKGQVIITLGEKGAVLSGNMALDISRLYSVRMLLIPPVPAIHLLEVLPTALLMVFR